VQVANALFNLDTPLRLLNAHNVESLLVRRIAETESSSWKKALITWQACKTLRAEVSALRFFDSCVAVSELDRAQILRMVPELPVSVVPNGVDVQYFHPTCGAPESYVMVLTGAMDWLPNVDGLTFFLRKVFPRIKTKIRQAELWIVGRNPPASLVRRHSGDGIHFSGTVDDVRPYMARASLVIVPLRIGGGTRLKILEAWAMGKAVLSTSIGAEGLPVIDGENIALADTPEQMTERAVALMNDPRGSDRLGATGRAMVEEHFTWKRIADALLQAYEATVSGSQRRWRRGA
jgi:glycosyltransferase involved in cell wall biosynthesis